MKFIRTHWFPARSQQNLAGTDNSPKLIASLGDRTAIAGGSQTRLIVIVAIGVALLAGLYFVAPMLVKKPSTDGGSAPAKPPADIPALTAKAEGGDAGAQMELGAAFANGDGVKLSYKEAAKWYRLAAEKGNAAAQTALGELCEAGQGTAQDDAEAAKWYQRAAEAGHAAGQYNLAVFYVLGKGVDPNEATAVKWFRQAADRGYALAQYNLGMRYLEAKGVKSDVVEAYVWLSLAKSGGIAEATTALDQLKPRMTSEQTAEGKRRAAAFVVQSSPAATK